MATSRKISRKTVAKVSSTKNVDNYLNRIETEIKSNQSTLSLILGILIVIVLGVLTFNYFNKTSQPSIQETSTNQNQEGDVSLDSLPGKYTVKEGDTLFSIADKYYKDGFKYSEIVKTNNLQNENLLEIGQVLDIPIIETAATEASPSENPSDILSASVTPQPSISPDEGKGGGDTTIWGLNIHSDTYTVVEGDWLSTIAGRAYGNIMAYQKIAEANNISNPDVIEPGTILKLPR